MTIFVRENLVAKLTAKFSHTPGPFRNIARRHSQFCAINHDAEARQEIVEDLLARTIALLASFMIAVLWHQPLHA